MKIANLYEASSRALQKAAQAWCTSKTDKKEMDSELAEAFADILDQIEKEKGGRREAHGTT